MDPIVSLITPTHRPDKLLRLYDSIAKQTDKRFEWVVIPNNGADVTILPVEPWIKIVPYNGGTNIGEIKKFSFMQGVGELLAEVDHDDELVPTCIETLINNKDKGDFIYSNNLVLDSNNKPYTWGPDFGWKYSTYNYKEEECLINVAFPPLPANFSWQFWAPNHIRVWRKDFYNKIGGHNSSLKACDDGELMCRSMMYGKIHHINEVLYIYYLHLDNSHSQSDLKLWIENYTDYMHKAYTVPMTVAWCKANNYNIYNTNTITLQSTNAGLIVFEDIRNIRNLDVYMMLAYNILIPGGILLLTNSIEAETIISSPHSKQISYWDQAYKTNACACFISNGVHIVNNTVYGYFTKTTENTHVAISKTDYSSILNNYYQQ